MSATLLKRRSGVAAKRADRAGASALPGPQERQRHGRASAPGRHPLAAAHHRADRRRHQGPHAGLGVDASTPRIRGTEGDKSALAGKVGALLAERAKAAGVSKVVFDRGGNRYAGRIAALADAAREAGLEF